MNVTNNRYDLYGIESKSFLRNAFCPNEASLEQRDDFLSEIGQSTFITKTETGCEICSSNIDMDDVLDCLDEE